MFWLCSDIFSYFYVLGGVRARLGHLDRKNAASKLPGYNLTDLQRPPLRSVSGLITRLNIIRLGGEP